MINLLMTKEARIYIGGKDSLFGEEIIGKTEQLHVKA